MKDYIFGERNGSTSSICRRRRSVPGGSAYVEELSARGGNIMFVGTKPRRRTPSARKRSAAAPVRDGALAGWAAHQLRDHRKSLDRLKDLEGESPPTVAPSA